MTHSEAIAIKVYYNMIDYANEEEIELRYNSHDVVEYYKDSKLTMKEYNFINKNLNESDKFCIDIIADYLTKLDEVHTSKVSI